MTKILEQLSGKFKWLKKIWADMSYQGKDYSKKMSKFLRKLEIVKRAPTHFWIPAEVEDVNAYLSKKGMDVSGGFEILPKSRLLRKLLLGSENIQDGAKIMSTNVTPARPCPLLLG